MNTLLNQRKKLEKLFIVNALVVLVASCGGGGGSADSSSTLPVTVVTPAPAPIVVVDYAPSKEKLSSAAQSSTELYVEPTFKFVNYQQVIVDIFVTDSSNQPLNNLMLSMSVINPEIVEHDDPRLQEKSLLTKLKTGANGRIYVELELPINVKKVLLELSALGIENDVIASVNDIGVIEHHFTQNK